MGTYYQRDTDSAVGFSVNTHEDLLALTTASRVVETTSPPALGGSTFFFSNTDNLAPYTWGETLADYETQLDVDAAGADVTYNILYYRMDAPKTGIVTQSSSSLSQSGTGLKVFIPPSSWEPNNQPVFATDNDRYGFRVVAANANMMTTQSFNLGLNTADSYANVPWNTDVPGAGKPPRRTLQAVHRASTY